MRTYCNGKEQESDLFRDIPRRQIDRPVESVLGNLTVSGRGDSAAAQLSGSQTAGNSVTATYTVPAPHGAFPCRRWIFAETPCECESGERRGRIRLRADWPGSLDTCDTPSPAPTRAAGCIEQSTFSRCGSIQFRCLSQFECGRSGPAIRRWTTRRPRVDDSVMECKASQRNMGITGEPGGVLPKGRWHLTLMGATIVDAIGQALVGNHGDMFVLHRPLVLK